MSLADGVAWEKEHGYEKPNPAKKGNNELDL